MKRFILALFLFLTFLSTHATEEGPKGTNLDCFKFPDSLQMDRKYCLTTTKGSDNPDVLYHFHGLLGSPTHWYFSIQNRAIRRRWEHLGFKAPTVVSVSFGRTHLMNPADGNPDNGTLDKMVREIIPFIEKKHNLNPPRRLCFGHSLGGFQCLQLFLRYPQVIDTFAAASIPLVTITPFSTQEEFDAFQQRTGASPKKIKQALEIAKRHYPTPEAWNKLYPLKFAEKYLDRSYSPFYISTSLKDDWGFGEGGQVLGQMALKRQIPIVYEEIDGGHSDIHEEGVADFLANF